MMRRFVLAALLAGCGVAAHYHPKSADEPPRVAERAIRIYPADVPKVTGAGAREVGRVSAQTPCGGSWDSLPDEASTVAAEHGGTHFVLEKKDSGGGQSGATFIVLHLPRERWAELPQALQPTAR